MGTRNVVQTLRMLRPQKSSRSIGFSLGLLASWLIFTTTISAGEPVESAATPEKPKRSEPWQMREIPEAVGMIEIRPAEIEQALLGQQWFGQKTDIEANMETFATSIQLLTQFFALIYRTDAPDSGMLVGIDPSDMWPWLEYHRIGLKIESIRIQQEMVASSKEDVEQRSYPAYLIKTRATQVTFQAPQAEFFKTMSSQWKSMEGATACLHGERKYCRMPPRNLPEGVSDPSTPPYDCIAVLDDKTFLLFQEKDLNVLFPLEETPVADSFSELRASVGHEPATIFLKNHPLQRAALAWLPEKNTANPQLENEAVSDSFAELFGPAEQVGLGWHPLSEGSYQLKLSCVYTDSARAVAGKQAVQKIAMMYRNALEESASEQAESDQGFKTVRSFLNSLKVGTKPLDSGSVLLEVSGRSAASTQKNESR